MEQEEMRNDDDLQEKLNALNALFASKIHDRFGEIGKAMQRCLDDVPNIAHLTELHRLLHSLAGSAGTFGFDGVGLLAREIESHVTPLVANAMWNAEDLVAISKELPALYRLAPVAGQAN